MRVFTGVVVCSLCLTAQAAAGDQPKGHHHWLRRITWAAGCAASFWEAQTTLAAVRRGAVEGNPLLADARGAPRWGRILSIKAAGCAGTYVVESLAARRGASDWYFTAANAATTAAFTGIAIHNIELRRGLERDAKAH